MGEERSPWRALRPVLLAGAAALSWLTFSSTQASADTLPDTSSLLGGVTSSVTSVTEKIAPAVPAAPAATPAAPPSAGLLQPVVGDVSGVADNLIAAVPVVNQVVPSGTVSAVATPIAQVADGASTALVETVVPPVAESLPVLEPVLQPVSDLVTGSAPLPVEVPELPVVVPAEDLPDVASPAPVQMPGETIQPDETAPLDAVDVEVAGHQAPANPEAERGVLALAGAAAPMAATSLIGEQPAGTDPSSGPALAPAVPGSGTGSGGSTGNSPGSAAWLSTFGFALPFAGSELAGEASDHAPAPVSFDPGSSPD